MFVWNTGSTGCSFFDASVVRYPSSYTYSLDATRTLTPVPGYLPGTPTFSAIDISATISSDWKYYGGVLGPNGKIYLVPYYADHVGEVVLGNQEPAYTVSGGVSEAWSALLSPHFNKF